MRGIFVYWTEDLTSLKSQILAVFSKWGTQLAIVLSDAKARTHKAEREGDGAKGFKNGKDGCSR